MDLELCVSTGQVLIKNVDNMIIDSKIRKAQTELTVEFPLHICVKNWGYGHLFYFLFS